MSGERRPPTPSVNKPKEKPVLDENGFQQLLAAAYVLQQHNDTLRAKDPTINTSAVLSEIAEIQSLVRDGGLDISQAAKLIAERLKKITSASGVSISLVTEGYLDCVAESGVAASIPGSSVASHSLVATEKLRSGEMFESADALEDIRLSVDICRELGVASLIAAPIHVFGEIAGLVEVRWDRSGAFQDSDLRACRLMAGLTTSVIERKSRGSEREGVPAVPGEERNRGATLPPPKTEAPPTAVGAETAKGNVERCRVCGRPFGSHEAFCGNCSLPRIAVDPSNELQSKWASLWYIQQAKGNLQARENSQARPAARPESAILAQNRARAHAKPVEAPQPERPAPPAVNIERRPAVADFGRRPLAREPEPPRAASNLEPQPVARTGREAHETPARTPASTPPVAKAESRPNVPARAAEARPERTGVTPAATAAVPTPVVPTPVAPPRVESRPVQAVARSSSSPQPNVPALRSPEKPPPTAVTVTSVRVLKPAHPEPPRNPESKKPLRFNLQAPDALVACGAILVAVVMLVLASARGQNSDLSWYDALMVNLGITRAPAPAQAFAGNPETRVWIDVHTGLYYCPGSDLYGKTPGGRFTDQLDAQKDQFEPASRSVCK
ncbi:MAG: GAF domain-containing protein [Acidobacteria bacterium]|nr:GAF domain-containing protein [Acidobacteriota bacterium]